MKTIGIAGYMGSGKSTFSRILSERGGFDIINGDAEAKKLMVGSITIQEQLISTFGTEIIERGNLSFKKLGLIAFSSMEKLQQLNAIVHPLLLDALQNMIFSRLCGTVIVDAALLPMWKIDEWFDTRIWMDASSTIRLDRILAKDNTADTTSIGQRMRLQEELFTVPSKNGWTYVTNDKEIEMLHQAVKLFIHV